MVRLGPPGIPPGMRAPLRHPGTHPVAKIAGLCWECPVGRAVARPFRDVARVTAAGVIGQ